MKALVWLRTDLRDKWNSALDFALEHHQQVTVVYCLTSQQWDTYGYAPCKINLILNRLTELKRLLAERNIELHLIDSQTYGQTANSLLTFCSDNAIQNLYFNAEYEWDERQRDAQVNHLLTQNNVSVAKFHDACLVKPSLILSKQQTPYKVFTPYFNRWLEILSQNMPKPGSNKALPLAIAVGSQSVNSSPVERPCTVPAWPYSDEAINAKLQLFIQEHAADYALNRDIPSVEGTSQMAAYLSIGAVSSAQCLTRLMEEHSDKILTPSHGGYTWLKELAWRDFYRYVMFHFPHVSRGMAFQKHYQAFHWSTNQQHFQAWCDGQTGYPIVDAAMIALKETGWMHNRLRMIVASFFCKHLLLPWKWGEAYFMSQLIDGDYASNNGGWQWSASVGTDAAPYFRIFNPTTQSERFDPQGLFIKKWLPQLSQLSPKQVHEPAKYMDVKKLPYPMPIVDHKASVNRTKEQFKAFLAILKP